MRAILKTYWITPEGYEISGAPDVCDIDLPEGDHHAGDRFDLPDGRVMVVQRKRNGVVELSTRQVWKPMLKETA
jgi:hypothetical protein